MSYQSVVLADSPLRYYRMNESSGTNVHDSGSQAQDGTLSGGVTLGQSGLVTNGDTSMLFGGTSGQISVPTTGLPTGVSAWSVETWVSLPTLTPGVGGNFYTAWGIGTANTNKFVGLYFRKTFNEWQVWDWQNNPIHVGGVLASTLYHLVTTYDGTTLTLYINTVATSAVYALNLSYGSALIGNDPGNAFFPGQEGEWALYGATLSSAQVAAHYNAGLAASLSTTLIRGHNRSRGHILEVESVYR